MFFFSHEKKKNIIILKRRCLSVCQQRKEKKKRVYGGDSASGGPPSFFSRPLSSILFFSQPLRRCETEHMWCRIGSDIQTWKIIFCSMRFGAPALKALLWRSRH